MKVILLKDVPKVGRIYEIKDVSDGYATNSLLPKGLVIPATPKNLADLQKKIEAAKSTEKIQEELLLKNFSSLKTIEVKIIKPANEEGHLFAGIHEDEISKAVEEQSNFSVPKNLIKLDQPIKTTGEHSVKIQSGEHKSHIKIVVEGK